MKNTTYYDFHTHTSFREGTLLPSELVQRNVNLGCRGLAITDHVDISNLSEAIDPLRRFVDTCGALWDIPILIGVELTGIPPGSIEFMTNKARTLGAQWVVVHGETLAGGVAPGTNRAAIEAAADLVSHPGLISDKEAELAASNGVYLEITTRAGHSLSNGWVARCAARTGAMLLLNSDTHKSSDILDGAQRRRIAQGAGLSDAEINRIWENSKKIVNSIKTPFLKEQGE